MQPTVLSTPQSRTDCERNTHLQKKGYFSFFMCRIPLVGGFLFLMSATSSARTTTKLPISQLWHEIAVPSRTEDSVLNQLVERHRYLPFVKRAILLQTDPNLLHQEAISITIGGHSATVQTLLGEINDSKSFVRYGALSDDRMQPNDPNAQMGDIFLAVQGGLITSKFYFEDEIYALIPIYKQYHLLLQFNAMRLPNECGTIHRFGATPTESPASADYRLRVLVAFSQIAMSGLKHYSLTLTPEHFAMMAIGENNLAHWRNPKRTPFLSLEKVTVLSYSELEMKRDLSNLAAEKPPFDLLQRWRTEAATDLQILIRSSEDALFGMAKTEADGWSSGHAFCVMTLDGFGFTPYSLAHQIEHLRPDANEPNDNTIAPSVFQTRLNHNALRNDKNKDILSNANVYPTRFFARHSIFYAQNRFSNIEQIDYQWIQSSADQNALLEYWDILPFYGHSTNSLGFHFDSSAINWQSFKKERNDNLELDALAAQPKLPLTIEISESNHAPKEDDDFLTQKWDLPDFRIMPNPTHGETFLEYRVAKDGLPIRLDLATLTGQFIARLAEDSHHPVGRFTVRWDTGGMPQGVYVCTLRIGDKVKVLRLVVE
jgi:hypothetical protein